MNFERIRYTDDTFEWWKQYNILGCKQISDDSVVTNADVRALFRVRAVV